MRAGYPRFFGPIRDVFFRPLIRTPWLLEDSRLVIPDGSGLVFENSVSLLATLQRIAALHRPRSPSWSCARVIPVDLAVAAAVLRSACSCEVTSIWVFS